MDDQDYQETQDKDEKVEVVVKVKNVTTIFEDETLSIISYIRKRHLYPPKPRKVAYNLTSYSNPSEMPSIISTIFKEKRNGIFIEAGACNGEFFSNTLDLERNYNWTGLLIEPNSFLWPELFGKNRKAWISDACLSIKPRPHKVTILHRAGNKDSKYQNWFIGNGVIKPSKDVPPIMYYNSADFVSAGEVECFPLYSILLAINMTKIDFFSLDVQAVEMKILKTIPFDLVDIAVFAIEFSVIPEGAAALREFMESRGYTSYTAATTMDYVFIKKNSDYAAAGTGLSPAA